MKHGQDYQVILSDQKIPVFVLPYNELPSKNAILLYDGGNHATLFRGEHDVLLIDYLPDKIQPYLKKCNWCVVIEKNKSGDSVARDYKVMVKIIKNNPLTDGIW